MARTAAGVRTSVITTQNLFKQSEAFTVSPWGSSINLTKTANAGVAPNGTSTATLIDNGLAVGVLHYFPGQTGIIWNGGDDIAVSLKIKAGTGQWFQMQFAASTRRANFDLVNGVIGSVSTGLTATMTKAYQPDGSWLGYWLCTIAEKATSTNTGVSNTNYFMIVDSGSATALPYSTGANRTFYVAEAQFASANWTGPYVKTTTAKVDNGNIGNLVSARTAVPTYQNLVLKAEKFDAWGKSNITVTVDQALGPFGGMTADLVDDGLATAQHFLIPPNLVTVEPYEWLTYTMYIKAGTNGQWFQLQSIGRAMFDVLNGVVGDVTAGGIASMTLVNGYYRCVYTAQTMIKRSVACYALTGSASNNGTTTTFAGNNRQYYLCGAQATSSNIPGPYVTTDGSVVNTGGIRDIVL